MDKRFLSPDSPSHQVANDLYQATKNLPLICPHGHVDPALLSNPDYQWGTPVDVLIIPDHYIFRMLYSQGIQLESLGIPTQKSAVETDHRKIWQIVCDHWYLFRGTPTGVWLRDELREIFGVEQKINSQNAQTIYDALSERLNSPEFHPRQLFKQFNIEVLATTDSATDTLSHHQAIRDSGWDGRIVPTFRPDAVVDIGQPDWQAQIESLSQVSGVNIKDFNSYIQALEQRRAFFKSMGATATDHAAQTAYSAWLNKAEVEAIFQQGLTGQVSAQDAQRFIGHMHMEFARMSTEDGLVMQLHIGSYRNHNQIIFDRFGANMGADIPLASEFTRQLHPLLNEFGNHPDLKLILFTLDETTYSRELAPLAGHYPALRLGPPWWFFDSLNGMRYYFEKVIETAGLYNTAGFNDDTRAYPSIPIRHDLWRRASANWLGTLVNQRIIDEDDAHEMMVDMAYGLAKRTYKLD
jgi:glucuronate isomerase